MFQVQPQYATGCDYKLASSPHINGVNVFLSGNSTDWCQKGCREWLGVGEVLKLGRIPMWAACGGAGGLAILTEHGASAPWDCPHCRDPLRPRIPIYTHIHDAEPRGCGDYSRCVSEKGESACHQPAERLAALQRRQRPALPGGGAPPDRARLTWVVDAAAVGGGLPARAGGGVLKGHHRAGLGAVRAEPRRGPIRPLRAGSALAGDGGRRRPLPGVVPAPPRGGVAGTPDRAVGRSPVTPPG